jgi:site-specific DNA-cytosine methylase
MFDLIHEDLASPARVVGRRSVGRSHQYMIVSLTPRDGLFSDLDVGDFVVQAEKHGVPQARHPIILLGIRDDLGIPKTAPEDFFPTFEQTPADKVLNSMPPIRSALSGHKDSQEAWLAALRSARDRRWLKSARRTGGPDVQDLIVETVKNLTVPQHDRGHGSLTFFCRRLLVGQPFKSFKERSEHRVCEWPKGLVEFRRIVNELCERTPIDAFRDINTQQEKGVSDRDTV